MQSDIGILEVTALKIGEGLTVQLVNGGGNHSYSSCATDDYIPPVLDIRLSIALDKKPQKLVLQPENKELEFEYKDGRAYVNIDRVNNHSIIEICE